MNRLPLFCMLLLLFFSPAKALERFDLVTTEELKLLLEQRQAGEYDFLLINTLDKLISDTITIPGSLNIPYWKLTDSAELLATDLKTPVVTYCIGYRWVFSYKAAVAAKNAGFNDVKIYNGGIRDWQKSGFPLARNSSLPEIPIHFIETDELAKKLEEYDARDCLDENNKPYLTLLDFRIEHHLEPTSQPPSIDTTCPAKVLLIDDIIDPEVLKSIPSEGEVVTLTETGGRDEYAIRYLSDYGFSNLQSLRFGMRGWLKKRYPIRK